MRLWLILLVGLLCMAMTSCPVPEDEYEDQQTAIDDEGKRQPEFTEEETAATDDEATVCEVCGQDPCVCGEDEMAGEEAGEEMEAPEEGGDDEAGEEMEAPEEGGDEEAGEEMEEPEGDGEEEEG